MNILVTGGSGTIGRFVCDRLLGEGHRVISFIRNVSRQLEFHRMSYHVGDIRNYTDIQTAIHKHGINGVIHCAANKHVNSCETQPMECIDTNINGVHNLIDAIADSPSHGVERFIFISTDKAAQPTSVYSMSKYLGEKMVLEYSTKISATLNSLRFGNVFGSAGSVIPIWLNLIRQNKPIELRTYQDKAPRRFCMTPKRASDFIVDIFHSSEPEDGTVIFKSCDIIDMGVLAHIMTEGTNSTINRVDMNEGENFTEMMYTDSDRQYLNYLGNNYYEISKEPQAMTFVAPPMTTDDGCMGFDQTRDFYNEVKSQLKL